MPPRDDILPLARLPRGAETVFDLRPEAPARAALADALGISAIRKLRLAGRLIPEGKRDWRLEGTLGATVVQPCVITTEPVTTRIDEPVLRRYLAEAPAPTGGEEVEMPEDDTVEPLPAEIDLAAVMAEALALALPAYPRSAEAELGAVVAGPPGVAPLTDEAARPLAGLAGLRDRLATPDGAAEDDPDRG